MARDPTRIFCQDDLETKLYHTALETAEDYSRQRLQSHLKFIRCELLHKLFSPCNCEKWVHPIFELSGHAKVDQIASVNVSA